LGTVRLRTLRRRADPSFPANKRGNYEAGNSLTDFSWGFGHFNASDRKPAAEAAMKTCFPCHALTKGSDLVFTHYAP
jgi:hypothetical protein